MTTLHVLCARGTEKAVGHEMKGLGAEKFDEGKGLVSLRVADEMKALELMVRANVFSRCASRVLLELAKWNDVATEDDLVEALSHVTFEDRLDAKGTLAVEAHLKDCAWTHEHYAAQRVKDVIVDRLRELGRGRPDVDTMRPSLKYVLHWERTTATLSLDTSGDSLHMRGYRRGVEGVAPMKETLAASILAIGHADPERPFLDPCCGTGTLAIEQALRALRRAPGRDRRFGFERWNKRPPEIDRALALARTEARDNELAALPAPIRLSDWHQDAVDAANECIEQAGLTKHLAVERVDARKAPLPGGDDTRTSRPVLCANLPFGERLAAGSENRLQLEGFYRTLGDRFRVLEGARVLLFSAHPQTSALLDLDDAAIKHSKWRLKSGPLDATLYRWDIRIHDYVPPPRSDKGPGRSRDRER
jgi:23S rRNA G2445 N2-methylase RlmL